MATDIEQELLEVFDAVGSTMSPSPDLADQVRSRVRTHRQRMAAVVAVVVLAVGGVTVVVANHGLGKAPQQITAGPQPRFRVSDSNVVAMAVRGNTLYVATNVYPKGLVTAYDRTSGATVRNASLPAGPSAIVVASDGTVWVTFYPSNAGHRAGVVEFSPTLSQRAVLLTNDRYLDAAPFDVLPLGRGIALVATEQGTVEVTLPRLGAAEPVQANRSNAAVAESAGHQFGSTTRLAALPNDAVATMLTSDGGQSRLVLSKGSAQFNGTEMTIASSPEGLWVTSGTGNSASLKLLDNTFAPLPTGEAINTTSLPGGADRVWTSGRTVWVATERRRVHLTCFAYASPTSGPSATITLPIADSVQRTDPIATGDVTIAPTGQTVYVSSPYGITSYPVPAVCR
jgi:hypothetical protein